MGTAESPPVLLFGSGLPALAVTRLLGRRGIRTLSTDSRLGGVRWSRWHEPAPQGAPQTPSVEHLNAYLAGCTIESAVLIACNDHWVQCLAARNAALHARFPASLAPAPVVERLVDKIGLTTALREAFVPHAETRALASPADLDSVSDEFLGRAFLKPADSQRFGPIFDAKALHVASRADATAKLTKAHAAGVAMLLQEYVPGPPTNHYFIDGFMDAGGAIRALFARQRYRMYPSDFGNSSYMGSIPVQEIEPASISLQRLLRHVGYRGIFSAEFKRDARDGEFRLLEVNVRPWWFVEFAARCGVDVCYLYYLDALGRVVPSVTEYALGERLVHPWSDYKAWGEARRAGAVNWWDHWRGWLGSHRTVFAWDDPLPSFANMLGAVRKRVAGNRQS